MKGLHAPLEPVHKPRLPEKSVPSRIDRLLSLSSRQRASEFESWFEELAREIDEWEVLASEHGRRSEEYDFIIWNSIDDSELSLLGNPIPVELKATKQLRKVSLEAACQRAQMQGLKSLLFCTTAEARKSHRQYSRDVLKAQDFFLVILDRDDLESVWSPRSMVEGIRSKLLTLMYEAENGI